MIGEAPRSCDASSDGGAGHLIIVGDRVGSHGIKVTGATRLIPASHLLRAPETLDRAQFFTDRIVLVGGTYSGSGDIWVTTRGVMPGVELIANTVQFAPLQLGEARLESAQKRHRLSRHRSCLGGVA